jgi:uncharacterized protein
MRNLGLFTICLLVHSISLAQDLHSGLPPSPRAYIEDHASVLSEDALCKINERLAGHEKETTDQIEVYLERRKPEGIFLDAYAKELFNQWGIGQRGKNNGVLILIFTEDRKIRITVGKGLEKVLPDEECGRIIRECMVTDFKAGNYASGIEKAISAIIRDLDSKLL